jgi:periplasmic divalent cation tolerance protein
MKPAGRYILVLVTAPDLATARRLAGAALEQQLAACANLVPGLESHYRWQGKIESAAEVLVIFKTRRSHRNALEKLVLSNHPYETAEFLVLPITSGSKAYLDWIGASTLRPQKR